VTVTVRQSWPKVPASAIDTGALARGFQYELDQKLAASGLSSTVSVSATEPAAGRRRRLVQSTGAAQVEYTLVVMVPASMAPNEVSARRCLPPLTEGRAPPCPDAPGSAFRVPHTAPASHLGLPGLQALGIAKAAAKAVATDAAILRRLLQMCLPADLFNSLDIDALIAAIISSTVRGRRTQGVAAPNAAAARLQCLSAALPGMRGR
jgi:hypothetical protein